MNFQLLLRILKFLNLNVTTACKVVLLPSSHPFGKIPGEPQLISAKLDCYMNNLRFLPLQTGDTPVHCWLVLHLLTDSPDDNKLLLVDIANIEGK